MLTLREQIIKQIEYMVIFDLALFFIPYPDKEDMKANSLEYWKTVKGYDTMIKTINSELPPLLRRAALRYLIVTLTDSQLLTLLTECIEQTQEQ